MDNCPFCENRFEEYKIKRYNYWTLYINYEQPYLGRCNLVLNRHLEDFSQISLQQREELWLLLKKLKKILDLLFNPDLYNYSSLGNVTRHLHLHIIPRYSTPREIEGFKFIDKRFGKNYAPHEKTNIPKIIVMKIKEQIQEKLK